MNDEEAVRRCQDGDREAFRHLVERYKDVLYGTACLMTGNASVAEEHVQESFLSAWKGMRGFRVGQPIKPWLVRILVNTVMGERRRRSIPTTSLEAATLSSDAGNPADLAERVSNKLEVRQAIAALSEEHKQVVMLRYFTGLSVPQLAQVLGLREGTVKSRLHRALRHLRDEMGKQPWKRGDGDDY